MKAEHIEAVVEMGLGVYTLLVALGLVKVSKNPEANVVWLRKWRWVFIVVTIFLMARGVTRLAGLHW